MTYVPDNHDDDEYALSPPSRTAADELQRFCDLFGHARATIWDRYCEDDRPALVHKLKIIYGTRGDADATAQLDAAAPIDAADVDQANARCDTDSSEYEAVYDRDAVDESKLDPKFVEIVDAIWNQRRYFNGMLLMSQVFVICVPTDEYQLKSTAATRFEVRPVFRIAKCFNAAGTTRDCCCIFVDDAARVYHSWSAFVANNQYGNGCVLVAPRNGIYTPNQLDGRVQLCISRAHHDRSVAARIDAPATVASIGSSALLFGAMVPFVAPLIPAVVLTAAVATGVSCSGYAVARGIGRLRNRAAHEQPIGLGSREARNVWLGVAANGLGLASGAAMRGVQMAASRGLALNRAVPMVVTSLSVAAIATNGVGVANGFYGWVVDGRISYVEALQLSGSLFLVTHSVRNFQTAQQLYVETQQSTLESFSSTLSKNQQKSYNKMLKETIRRNGDTGTADVIRSLRSISNHKGFFRDMFKINGKLNENGVRISFDRNGRPVLNGEVPFEAAQLRADLRTQPASEVFANATAAGQQQQQQQQQQVTGGSGAALHSSWSYGSRTERTSTMAGSSVAAEEKPQSGSTALTVMPPPSVLQTFALSLSDSVRRRCGNPLQLVSFVWRYYAENRDLIADRLTIHFDGRFVEDVCRAVCFLADQAGQLCVRFVCDAAVPLVWRQLNAVYESRLAELTIRAMFGSLHELYESLAAGVARLGEYVHDANGFRETVVQLLDELGSEVVGRLLRVTDQSFGWLVAMALHEFPAFEAQFGEVLEVATAMAQQAGFNDMSLYVLLWERPQMDAVVKRVTAYYGRLVRRREGKMTKCEQCCGSYSVTAI